MDLKLMCSTFLVIFLAELGDKTQLATLSLAAQGGKKWDVFLGASVALVLTSLIGTVLGSTLGHMIRPAYVRLGAGLLFIVLGSLMIFGKL
jgi:putative Ca2+/H+ antiporter (TMEM165/GDT1 family)